MADTTASSESTRKTATAAALITAAAGAPALWSAKLQKVGHTLISWGRTMRTQGALDARLAPLVSHGLIPKAPTRLQLLVGSIDMVRFWISPAAADYYAKQGISFTFHQLLRVLDDPAAMLDPVGFFVDADAVIGHLLQVVHANPVYDVQLLSTHVGGLDSLESQTRAVIAGTHPRAASIGAIVEEADYHHRLLAYVEQYRRDPRVLPPVRSNIHGKFVALEETFGTLPSAMRYFLSLPTGIVGAAKHLVTVTEFPGAQA